MAANDTSDAPPVRDDEHELTARLSTAKDGTAVCTIYPAHVGTLEQTPTWIRAEDESFVAVEDCN